MPQVISASFLKAKRIDAVVTITRTLSFIVSTSEQGVRQRCLHQSRHSLKTGLVGRARQDNCNK
jgi:hypothetical protein